jgi:diguanylate cyclase (GGDEF)-like protein
MSFRARLTLFFVAIVIVPMATLAVALFWLIANSEDSREDARANAGLQVIGSVHTGARRDADRIAGRVGADPALATALRGDRADEARGRTRALLASLDATRIRIVRRDGTVLVDVGRPDGVGTATKRLEASPGVPWGRIEVTARDARAFVREASALTEAAVVVRSERRVLASTVAVPRGVRLANQGDVTLDGRRYRVATTSVRGGGLAALALREERTAGSAYLVRGIAGALLAGFLLLALVSAVLVSRSLQRSILVFLEAARRIGRGDFKAQVPVQGRDEFAALGGEFNHMARELEARLQELARQRARLQTTVRRVGEAFGSNLDRPGLLQLIVSTTVDGVVADGGRARSGDESVASGPPEALEQAVRDAEARVTETGEPYDLRAPAGAVLAHPLRGPGDAGPVAGVVSVWRRGRPFSPAERELFTYLASQGGASLENVALHERVQRQAVTDELTGLANHRAFQEALASEIERARRFETSVGLVLIDIDDFKRVNDTHGHQTGDRVLAAVARVLRNESREIDHPARYGGEELAVVLPGADLDGAHGLAERVRRAIAALEVPLGGDGPPLRITASFGVASLPECADDQVAVIAAADEAMYEAKRSGKNRTVRAGTLRTHGTAR